MAAREGGGDPAGNATLATAMQKARDASMPKDNIERAIAKGTGEGADAAAIEAVVYEGYGPGGVAMLIETLTDNRNRTGSDVRHLLTKHGGTLGEPGSVAYLFDKRGLILVDAARYSEDDLIGAIDAGALDIETDDDVFEVDHRARRPAGRARRAGGGAGAVRVGRGGAAPDARRSRWRARTRAGCWRWSRRWRSSTTSTPCTPTSTWTPR